MLGEIYEPRFRLVGKIFLLIIARIPILKMAQFPAQYAIDAPELYFEKEKFLEEITPQLLINYRNIFSYI